MFKKDIEGTIIFTTNNEVGVVLDVNERGPIVRVIGEDTKTSRIMFYNN